MKIELDMRHLEVFRAVMISGSLVGAARLLSVTQPALSRTIALLEMRLAYPLFHRRGRRLVPTTEAHALYREVERMYVGIDRIKQVAWDIGHHRAGALRVATLPALAQWLVPAVLARFLAARPHVHVFVQALPSTQIAELVVTRQFDLGVVEMPMSRSGVRLQPLPSASIVAVLPAGHVLERRTRLSLRDLAGERLLLPSPQSYVRYQIDDAFNRLGLRSEIVVETPTSSLACALAAEGAGVGLVSEWTPMPGRGDRFSVRPLAESLWSQYGCITPAEIELPALAGEFQAMLRARMVEGALAHTRGHPRPARPRAVKERR